MPYLLDAVRVGLLPVALFGLLANSAPGQISVREIEMHSGWNGLGRPANEGFVICAVNGGFVCNGNPVDGWRVQALVKALKSPSMTAPTAENLGATSAWLREQVAS